MSLAHAIYAPRFATLHTPQDCLLQRVVSHNWALCPGPSILPCLSVAFHMTIKMAEIDAICSRLVLSLYPGVDAQMFDNVLQISSDMHHIEKNIPAVA